MHEVLVNRLGGLSLPRKSVVRLTDRPDMTLDVYRGRKTTIQHTSHVLLIPHTKFQPNISSCSGKTGDFISFALFSNDGHLEFSTRLNFTILKP